MNEGTYAIGPAQCPTSQVLLTTGLRRALNERILEEVGESGGENDPRAEELVHEEEDTEDWY